MIVHPCHAVSGWDDPRIRRLTKQMIKQTMHTQTTWKLVSKLKMLQKTLLMENMVPNKIIYLFFNTRKQNQVKIYARLRARILHRELELNWMGMFWQKFRCHISKIRTSYTFIKIKTLMLTRMRMAVQTVKSTVLLKAESASHFSED